jgi:hypothetical protein
MDLVSSENRQRIKCQGLLPEESTKSSLLSLSSGAVLVLLLLVLIFSCVRSSCSEISPHVLLQSPEHLGRDQRTPSFMSPLALLVSGDNELFGETQNLARTPGPSTI